MDDLRYPVGTFAFDKTITPDKRAAWIRQIAEAPALMRAAVNGLSDRQFDAPYRPGGWTVRQVVHHVPDSHLNAYCRFKFALTEDNPTIKPYDEAAWANVADTAADASGRLAGLARRAAPALGGAARILDGGGLRSAAPASRARRDYARLDAATLRVARTASRRARDFAACAGAILNAEC